MTGQGSRSSDPDLLRQVGSALYGSDWRSRLKSELDINDRTFRRWMDGEPIPDGVLRDVAAIAGARLVQLKQATDALRERAPGVAKICPACNETYSDGDTCFRGGCPMGGDF